MRATNLTKLMAVAVLGAFLVATPAEAQRRGFRGGVRGRTIVVPSYRVYGGFGPRFYDPFWYGGSYYYATRGNMGEVKIKTRLRDAEVLVDGAYAGTTSERKRMWLRAGAHTITIRAAGYPPFHRRIYVLSGRSLTILPGF
jgi:hypothetical protein